jgi:undecaprenyl-diphosphatase
MSLSISIIAIILGIVEGLTEFLPVSSTGHLIVFDRILQFKELLASADKAELFEVVIQLGAILAIGVLYRKRLMSSLSALLRFSTKDASGRLGINLIVAFLPAAIFGYLFHPFISKYLFSSLVVGITLVVGGIIIIAIEKKTEEDRRTITLDTMTWRDALVVGLAQVLSLIPGTSRSAATIMGGLLRGIKRPAATEFSFILAFPVMVAASGYEMLKYRHLLTHDMLGMIGIGFVTSFVVALVVVAWFVRYIQRHEFTGFGIYRIVFGAIVLVLYAVGYLA